MTKHSDLNSAAIAAHCATGAAHVCIEVVDETGSTNADLLARCATLAGPTLRIAGQQTAGRGRAGRPWVSQPDASLMFSLAWRFKGPLHQLVGLPLAVGVARAESMTALGVPVQLKWPNDMLKDGHKLAGILVETQQASRRRRVGRHRLRHQSLMPMRWNGRSAAASRRALAAQMERNTLVAALLSRLAGVLAESTTRASRRLRSAGTCCSLAGPARENLDNGQLLQQGVAAGVDHLGRLLLRTDGGLQEVMSGDVSLRLLGE